MLAGAGDIGGVVAVFVGQGAGELSSDGLGVGNDPRNRLAKNRRDLPPKGGTDGGLVQLPGWTRLGSGLVCHQIELEAGAPWIGKAQRHEMGFPVTLRTWQAQARAVKKAPVQRLFVSAAFECDEPGPWLAQAGTHAGDGLFQLGGIRIDGQEFLTWPQPRPKLRQLACNRDTAFGFLGAAGGRKRKGLPVAEREKAAPLRGGLNHRPSRDLFVIVLGPDRTRKPQTVKSGLAY